MACLSLCVPEGEIDELLEHVPLSTRRKLLLSPTVSFENQAETSKFLGPLSLPPCSARDQVDQQLPNDSPNCKVTTGAFEVATIEDPVGSSTVSQGSPQVSSFNDVGLPINGNSQGHQLNKMTASCQDIYLPIIGNSQGSESDQLKGSEADASELEEINVCVRAPLNLVPSDVSPIEKVNCADNMPLSLSKGDTNNSVSIGDIAVNKMDKKLSDCTFGELDHIVLKERRKLLLKRKFMELERPPVEGTPVGLTEDTIDYSTRRIKQELQPIDANGSSSLECYEWRNKKKLQHVDGKHWSGTESDKSGNQMGESNIIRTSERTSIEFKLRDGDDFVSATTNNLCNSTLDTSVKVKDEPLHYNNLQNPERSTFNNMVSVKCEEDISDGMDHMLLRDRMKLPSLFEDFKLNSSAKSEPAAFGDSPFVFELAKPTTLIHRRSRKKTATDSVATALEEDAPGLLKVLLDKGVSVNEIKLYGESENGDPIDESFSEDSFSELEDIMTKLFAQRSQLFKFTSIRCPKGPRPSYCLTCLFSLVEQTRYLQFRKWPVEWGWCRDLQSFIFVFKRHHRIVLERPEYGFATYFFELLDSLPVGWQVMRLVTAMKLTSCGRITLIENKPLSIGEDLSEGEAKVLMQYGWVPNTGLGTMLKYCDRVVHDRKNEGDMSEWRSKIGKLLVDAYNSGTIVSSSPVEDVNEEDGVNREIKQEL
ncbi:uncharacterized protein LOC120153119 isoform X2 [Hibiscus syriacus]|uniref:uncharacterized protein LOC120153119 isoform X2 n=1 Tax=Hibiscus syriacus TaxID=106335 RepID=UPI001920A486|nr:uncharacterized protein LOC120153119 isoform X2 [Hibiscus syriacus]